MNNIGGHMVLFPWYVGVMVLSSFLKLWRPQDSHDAVAAFARVPKSLFAGACVFADVFAH